jgi:hypothetical protein
MIVQTYSGIGCRRIKLAGVHSQCTRLYIKYKLKKKQKEGAWLKWPSTMDMEQNDNKGRLKILLLLILPSSNLGRQS